MENNLSSPASITACNKVEPKVEVLTAKDEEDCSLLRQWREIKAQYPDALLLFRVGDFYEAYKEDAEQATKILGITLTHRGKSKILFCGFPFHALDTYLPKLVRAGHRVAICDQLEDVKKATKNLVKRGTTELSKL
ncbi:MAG: hypothetical protein IKN39_04520 [Clostridia bacterium]|nr:hypothetical protein [Paludibacteraceae bacterium]MBR6903134.1 hypothetical protein [Clostridia bacterium]